MSDSASMKYLLDLSPEDLKPYAVISPYFYMTETSINRWLDVNVMAAKLASNYKNSCKLFVELVISQGILLSEKMCDDIIKGFSETELDGFIIWVDDLDEHKAGGAELKGLIYLAKGLRNRGNNEVINLHGGYFSILAAGTLGDSSFSGVAHGPEFGEHRPVVPVGGGIPIARYYVPKLHERVKYRDTIRILTEKRMVE